MPWSVPPTFSSPWNFSDANTYIRDNWTSMRRYMAAPQVFIDGATFNTSATSYGSHTPLTSTQPDEAVRMLVLLDLYTDTASGSPTTLTVLVRNNANTDITVGGSPFNITTVGSPHHTLLVGACDIAANTDCGYHLRANCNAGTMTANWTALVFVSPQV